MHIVGGGIIGLCCAWYLRKAGYDVTVIDRTSMDDGCSFVNAGIVVPSHFVPLASPGVISRGIRWMFNARSPFYIRPRLDIGLLRWTWQFYRSCTPSHVAAAAPVLRDFHLLSKSLYEEFNVLQEFSFDFEENGSIMLFRTARGREEELENMEYARRLGLHAEELALSEIAAKHHGMHCDVLGGVHYHDDAHLYPSKFVLQLTSALQCMGVQLKTSAAVAGFRTDKEKVTHLCFADGSEDKIDEMVLACGAWTPALARQLGIRMLIQDGKGYSVTLPGYRPRPPLPVILTEGRVAITPMGSDLRIGGTLEVSHFSPEINHKRVEGILRTMTQYYPDFPLLSAETVEVRYGFRPVSADGLPYLGRPKSYSNVIIAAGHAMLGMSLGPATGLLVSEIAQGEKTSLPTEFFRVDRH